MAETTFLGTGDGSSPRWSTVTTNGLGWTVNETKPSPAGAGQNIVTTHFYNTRGQRIKTSRTGLADTLYVYDSFGRLAAQGQDFNQNGVLDVGSGDPLTVTQTSFALIGSDWYEATTTAQYLNESAAAPETVIQQVLRSLNGDLIISASSDGTRTSQATVRDLANHLVITTTSSNRGGLAVQSVTQNGLLVSQTSPTSATPSVYTYDDIERPSTSTDASGMVRLTTYADQTAGGDGLIPVRDWAATQQIKPAGAAGFTLETATTYDPASGLPLVQTNAAGETTTSGYDSLGHVIRQAGTSGYPVAYAYNSFGDLVTMGTFQTAPTTDTFDLTGAQLTSWAYDDASGALLAKTDAAGKSVQYTYQASGALNTRQWARGVTLTYGYDSVGRLTDISYSDGTPAVHHTYYRNGERQSTSDAQGLHQYVPRTLALASAGADGTFQAATESLTPTSGGSQVDTREQFDGQGRRSRWTLNQAGTVVNDMSYSYTGGGQLSDIGFMSDAGHWTYYYQSDTGLTSLISAVFAGGATVELSKLYDARLRLQSLAYQVGGSTRLGWAYGYEAQHPERRTSTTSLVPALPGWAYGYDSRGQVTAAARARTSDGTPVPGQSWGYAYDAIGNRTASSRGQPGESDTGGVRTTSYAASSLNQYSSITRPNAVEVTGVTFADVPTVKVNGQPATGRPPGNGEPGGFAQWLNDIAGDSLPNGQWPEVTLEFKKPGAGMQGHDLQHTRTGHVYVRPSETPLYDDDGNLIQDAGWIYSWDGENRLIAAEMRDVSVPASVDLRRVEFSYDAKGRRFERRLKVKATPAGSTVRNTAWQEVSHVHFWYDGWNLAAETDASGVVHQYIWGTDLSGTLQGAGGVGGLLGVATAGHMYAVCTEVNGNVMGLVDGQTGQLVARWDYDPFGNLVTDWYAPGVTSATCPMRFSSKVLDPDLGWYYYGYRYYQPESGRWAGRDPIGENGGINLYGMVENDPVNEWDYLGQKSYSLTYSTGEAPRAGESGQLIASWFIRFDLSPVAQNGGVIIQTMTYPKYEILKCDGSRLIIPMPRKFHESFAVEIGGSHSALGDDWGWPIVKPIPCTKGTLSFVGEARFYANKTETKLKSHGDWKVRPDFRQNYVGPTSIDTGVPTFWFRDSNKLTRKMTVEWDSRPPSTNKSTKVTYE